MGMLTDYIYCCFCEISIKVLKPNFKLKFNVPINANKIFALSNGRWIEMVKSWERN